MANLFGIEGEKQIVTEIKLKDLLTPHFERFGLKQYQTAFPPVEIGSITLVDQVVIAVFLDMLAPEEILEIGTYKGFTSRFILDNTTASSLLVTVDLPESSTEALTQNSLDQALSDADYNDDYLRRRQRIEGEVYLDGVSDDKLARIKLVKQDSTTISYSEYFKNLSMAFIDGGHDYQTVKADTEAVMSEMKEGVILWHDYSSGIHSDVTRYIKELSAHLDIFHVKGSLLAFAFISN